MGLGVGVVQCQSTLHRIGGLTQTDQSGIASSQPYVENLSESQQRMGLQVLRILFEQRHGLFLYQFKRFRGVTVEISPGLQAFFKRLQILDTLIGPAAISHAADVNLQGPQDLQCGVVLYLDDICRFSVVGLRLLAHNALGINQLYDDSRFLHRLFERCRR